MLATERRKVTPPQLAKRWGVATNKILAFIASGELRAVNLATSLKDRPRWFIDEADIERFERFREATPAAPRVRKRRQSGVKDYFPHIT